MSTREPLLRHAPDAGAVSLAELVGLALAVETEAVRRYDALAQWMARRGEAETAAAFRTMADEERRHAQAVATWAGRLAQPVPEAGRFAWRLPPEIGASWDEVAGSALLTPYRAFAIAVDNEQRAFVFYSYIAAHATDARVAAEAERLALEELRHAALLRGWRRRAWHRERSAAAAVEVPVEAQDVLDALIGRHEAAIATRHRGLAASLRALGDEPSARLLDGGASSAVADAGEVAGSSRVDGTAVLPLLVAAQAPLESFAEALEAVLRTAEGALFTRAQRALEDVVARIARVAMQAERRGAGC